MENEAVEPDLVVCAEKSWLKLWWQLIYLHIYIYFSFGPEILYLKVKKLRPFPLFFSLLHFFGSVC